MKILGEQGMEIGDVEDDEDFAKRSLEENEKQDLWRDIIIITR